MLRWLTLLFLLTGIHQVSAQNLEMRVVGNATIESGTIISRQKVDVNAMPVAGIRIISTLVGLKFDSNNGIVGSIESGPGYYIMYLSTTERKITVLSPNHKPLDIILSNVGIRLKAQEVWRLEITGDMPAAEEVSELLELKRQREAAEKRREDEERATRQKALERQQALLVEEQRKLKEADDARKIEEQKKADAKNRFITENQQKKPIQQDLTLAGALARWAELDAKKKAREKELYDLRDQAIKLAVNVGPKDEFESQKEYESRLRANEMKKAAIEAEYEVLKAEAWKPINEQLAELEKFRFPPKEVRISLGTYDAEAKEFSASISVVLEIQEEQMPAKTTGKPVSKTRTDTLSFDYIIIPVQPSIARLFRQNENLLIHDILGYVASDGKLRVNTVVTLKEPVEGNTIAIKLVEPIVNSLGARFMPIPGRNYAMGKYEVTQKEWVAIMGSNPSNFKGDNRPVEWVRWNDVQEFIKKLNAREGGNKYRLPTEEEWEHAARAGSTGAWCFGDDESKLVEYAWYEVNSGSQTHSVGQKKPNKWGLHDMHGNVWEWTETSEGSGRVYRGGSWGNTAPITRAAYRYFSNPDNRGINLGFRLLRLQ